MEEGPDRERDQEQDQEQDRERDQEQDQEQDRERERDQEQDRERERDQEQDREQDRGQEQDRDTTLASMDFRNVYAQGFVRVAACTMPTTMADPAANAETLLAIARECHDEGVGVAVFPELCLTGYSIDDLHLQDVLLDAARAAIESVREASADLTPVLVIGAPLAKGHRVYNCAVVVKAGEVLGVVPKSYLPDYREFYEGRHFAAGDDQAGEWITLGQDDVPFGPDLLFEARDVTGLVLHVEVCEDMWVPLPPSAAAALAGATVLANASSSPITVAKAEERHLICRSSSTRCLAAYVYAAAGEGESTTDLAWDGQTMIYDNGQLLAETERFPSGPRRSVADVDLTAIRQERLRQTTFDDNRRSHAALAASFRVITFDLNPPCGDLGLKRRVDRFPFVPDDPTRLAQDCYEAYNIQVSGLEQRMRAIGSPKIVLGVSGGLDSTHALIVAARAMDRLGRPRSDILAFTLPGFATTDHTKNNATVLSEQLGVTFEEVDIKPMCTELLSALGHPAGRGEPVYDVTFENVQAGVRTDFLFRAANQRGGIVLGTGDLSELALGWCTYGVGDQMSHYGVNAGVPKTLMQHLIRWAVSSQQFSDEVGETLLSILDTEITPELIPTVDGEKPQSTQVSIGPYALHDFTLYYLLRFGMRPSRIAFLAEQAWADVASGEWPLGYPDDERTSYDIATIRSWLAVFVKRFFGNQFKRSAMPNGPKVLRGGALSPRGDWRMPSDVAGTAWLAELENIPEH